jgi:hypothetical protein
MNSRHAAWKEREIAASPKPPITPEQRAADHASYARQLAEINRRAADAWLDSILESEGGV